MTSQQNQTTVAIPCGPRRTGAEQVYWVEFGQRSPTNRWFVRLPRPELSGLAGFLAAYGVPNAQRYGDQTRLRLIGAESVAEQMLRDAQSGRGLDVAAATAAAQRAIAAYDLDRELVSIEDYRWPAIDDDETPAQYFGRVAATITALGVSAASIRGPLRPAVEWRSVA